MADRTFKDLGIPFPLFEAPVDATSDYAGIANCDICGGSQQHGFRIGIGGYVKLSCKQCHHEQFAQGHEAFSAGCDECGTQLMEKTASKTSSDEYPVACYNCLRAGRASITKDTEFGMITYEHAQRGITHGVPGLATTMFEALPPNDEGWVCVKIPNEYLNELVSTPGYLSWQGDIWLFCCQAPMTFIGEWHQSDFRKHATDGDALRLAKSMVSVGEYRYWDDEFPDHLCFYVFRCKTCGSLKAHVDMD